MQSENRDSEAERQDFLEQRDKEKFDAGAAQVGEEDSEKDFNLFSSNNNVL
jgi:hypothetical protein